MQIDYYRVDFFAVHQNGWDYFATATEHIPQSLALELIVFATLSRLFHVSLRLPFFVAIALVAMAVCLVTWPDLVEPKL